MPRHPDSQRFHELLESCGKLHDQKQTDYGNPGAPFANLEASQEFGVPNWLGSLIRLNDKVNRLKTYAKTRKLANEGVADSLQDIAVYALATLVLFEKEEIAAGRMFPHHMGDTVSKTYYSPAPGVIMRPHDLCTRQDLMEQISTDDFGPR